MDWLFVSPFRDVLHEANPKIKITPKKNRKKAIDEMENEKFSAKKHQTMYQSEWQFMPIQPQSANVICSYFLNFNTLTEIVPFDSHYSLFLHFR